MTQITLDIMKHLPFDVAYSCVPASFKRLLCRATQEEHDRDLTDVYISCPSLLKGKLGKGDPDEADAFAVARILQKCPAVTKLVIPAVFVANATVSEQLERIKDVSIYKSKSRDASDYLLDVLSPLARPAVSGLTRLCMQDSHFFWTLSHIGKLTSLLTLDLSKSTLDGDDWSPLSKLTKLKFLDVSMTNFKDLSVLAGCNDIRYINLDYTSVEDLSMLSHCPRLEYVGVNNRHVRDLTPLRFCVLLKGIEFNGDYITDVSPLASCTQLEIVCGINSTRRFATLRTTCPKVKWGTFDRKTLQIDKSMPLF